MEGRSESSSTHRANLALGISIVVGVEVSSDSSLVGLGKKQISLLSKMRAARPILFLFSDLPVDER